MGCKPTGAVAHGYGTNKTGREIDHAHGQCECTRFSFGKQGTLREKRIARVGDAHTGISYGQRYLRQNKHDEGSPIIPEGRGNETDIRRSERKSETIESAEQQTCNNARGESGKCSRQFLIVEKGKDQEETATR